MLLGDSLLPRVHTANTCNSASLQHSGQHSLFGSLALSDVGCRGSVLFIMLVHDRVVFSSDLVMRSTRSALAMVWLFSHSLSLSTVLAPTSCVSVNTACSTTSAAVRGMDSSTFLCKLGLRLLSNASLRKASGYSDCANSKCMS